MQALTKYTRNVLEFLHISYLILLQSLPEAIYLGFVSFLYQARKQEIEIFCERSLRREVPFVILCTSYIYNAIRKLDVLHSISQSQIAYVLNAHLLIFI